MGNSYLGKQNHFQGPFDTFLVGGDTAEVSDIKFSNDGKSVLLTTTNNHIYVLDAYGGEKVSLRYHFRILLQIIIFYYILLCLLLTASHLLCDLY
jgi:hypothetical protein